jgi:hypothetical protein
MVVRYSACYVVRDLRGYEEGVKDGNSNPPGERSLVSTNVELSPPNTSVRACYTHTKCEYRYYQ